MEVKGTGGSRKIPTFQRPMASITTNQPKKSWKEIPVEEVRVNDIVADYGLVREVRNEPHRTKLTAGDRDYFVSFVAGTKVMAFTEDPI